MQKLVVLNQTEPVGTWAAYRLPGLPAGLHDRGPNTLIAAVRAEQPHYARTPEIMRLARLCRDLLLKNTSLSSPQITELLTFEGTAKAFTPILRQALRQAYTPEAADTLEVQLENLRGLKVNRLWSLIKDGALGGPAELAWGQFNKVLDAYTTTQSKLMRGIGGVNDTLEVQGCVVGAGYSAPATSQTGLDHQISTARTPDDSTYTGYQTTFLTGFRTAHNNGATTDIASVTNSTTFTLTSATNFAIGDRIAIGASQTKRTIANLVGTTVTLDEALTGMTAGDDIIQCWGETGLLINGNSVQGTRSRISDGGFPKTDLDALYIESAITLRIVGS